MALWQWSTTPATNASAGAIDWAEGQPPSTVNDSARQMMADIATWFQSPEWLNYGLTPTYISTTQFTLTGNQTNVYSNGRRVRAFVTAGTIYGTIVGSTFTSLTTVTVVWDTGNLDSGLSEADVGILNPLPSSFPTNLSPAFNNVSVDGTHINLGIGQAAEMDLLMNNASTEGQWFLNTSGACGFFDITRSLLRFSSDTSGNMTIAGTLTQSSDERLKTDWKPVSDDFLEKLSAVKSGTFRRTDIGEIQAGVSAQDLQQVIPEAVGGGAILSVAYGQAALVACVELAKEVVRLRALLEPVK